MSYKITIIENGKERVRETEGNETLLAVLQNAGSTIHAPCGGNGTCRRCTVNVSGDCRAFDGTVTHYEDGAVLSCRVYPESDLRVTIEQASGGRVLANARDIDGSGKGYGLAFDIGTTTIAGYLYDLEKGKCLETIGEMNMQRSYGADVVSRIRYCSEPDGQKNLTALVRKQILKLSGQLCAKQKLKLDAIRYISIAGNTVMEHIFAGLSPVSIGVAPYKPQSLFGKEYSAGEFFSAFSANCKVYICPAIAGYVGGDITAGLVSSGACDSQKTLLFIDVGTNGEMALGNADGFVCCATAAGPAFEGAEMECGSSAQDGAINTVNTDLSFTVLGDGEAKSICGSGLLDAVGALLYNEILDDTGRMDGERYNFTDKVWISAADVRKLQLAKAAIRAGIETLLYVSGTSYGEISDVLIAGGFGAYLRKESSCAIGMLPPAFLEKTIHIGNSAGMGAALALTEQGRKRLNEVAKKCRYEELSASQLFNNTYIDAMMFDDWEKVYHD